MSKQNIAGSVTCMLLNTIIYIFQLYLHYIMVQSLNTLTFIPERPFESHYWQKTVFSGKYWATDVRSKQRLTTWGKKRRKKKPAPMWRKQSRVKTYPLLLWVIHFNSAVCVWSWNHDKVNEALKATGTPYSPVKRSPVKTVGFFFCLQIRCCTTEVLFPLRGKFSLYSYFLISSIAAKYMSAAKTPRLPN